MLHNIFKEQIHKFGRVNNYIEESLVKELHKKDLKNISPDKISKIAQKISYFMYLDKHIDVKCINIYKEIVSNRTYDFEPQELEHFIGFYNRTKKDDLLVLDNDNLLKLKNSSTFISHYKKKDIVGEYFNYLLFQFNKNLEAMKNHMVSGKSATRCGFYGYIHLIDTLLEDESFFTR